MKNKIAAAGLVKCMALLVLLSCHSQPQEMTVTREEQVIKNLDSLKRTCMPGDLIVRLGDDILSYQIKNMNETEMGYSHAGVIVDRDGKKMVAHIAPEENGADTIQYMAIDSFLVPAKNIEAALYRYNFSVQERQSFVNTIDSLKKNNLHFDWMYDLSTDDKMYCSEMISKALYLSTNGRVDCKETSIPKKVLPALYNYFNGKASKEAIARRKIMTIDNLYLRPDCRLAMKFRLKYLPGE